MTTDTHYTCKSPYCDSIIVPTGKRGRPPVYCPDCKPASAGATNGATAPWRVDDEGLARAAEHLGLTKPIHVKRSKGVSLLGTYRQIRNYTRETDGGYKSATVHKALPEYVECHVVTVSARLTPDQASRVIWHELTHAAQRERDPESGIKYSREVKNRRCINKSTPAAHARYESIPYEVEARKNEALHDTVGSIATSNTGWSMGLWQVNPRITAATVHGVVIQNGLLNLIAGTAERLREAHAAWDETGATELAALEGKMLTPLPKTPVWSLVG
jgi:hypothetical protein